MNALQVVWSQGDGVSRAVALLLLAMSVSAWVLIFWKTWVLQRARRDLGRIVPAFWDAPDLSAGQRLLAERDREAVLLPMLDAARAAPAGGSLAAGAQAQAQLTRRLRDALHGVLAQLQQGQVVLASIGATAPFIGLFGTVWGIYHALVGISASGSVSIDKVAGPVGEALIMTAAGLAVAIPAVLAYNLFGRWLGACEADLEGWAHDLRELFAPGAASADADEDR
ncbi:MotA/TolQ/ExbB proton channel family protein [Leptothrix discophora]|uniref:Biopolymer transport protein ExbB n=1 Tax=Leptothrix discophora TaxID=89 RepID=A0ABT9G6X5_LEPDI|nr:MotA/TolQ/ExbB proton channel family protein [Leptothrix discophora]MDP4302234.1 MotA/TolQ/ExbB proton channel family protein [Leptothrix discophora]